MKKVYYDIIKPFIPGLLYGGGLLFLVLIFKPSIYLISILLSITTLYFSIRAKKRLFRIFKDLLFNNAILGLMYAIWVFIGVKGLLGLIVACVLVALIIIFRRRKLFINTIKSIEKIIYKEE